MSDWIEEQKKNVLFRQKASGGDASRMLEISPTNRYINSSQAKRLTSARYIGELLGVKCYNELADLVEKAELCVDGRSRADYMKVAIEQWQGKISSLKSKINLEALA